MNRVLTCVGAYAETPYYVDRIFINVYCIEELCYVLYENAFLIDREIMDVKLAQWIERELKLPELARDLFRHINSGSTAAEFVVNILEYVGYYDKEEIAKAESILKMNVSMSIFERMKAKADFLVESKHFVLALKEYDRLLKILPEEESELRSKVYNNMGITYMNLYLYDSAEQCFLLAYEKNEDETAYKHYLTVKRMSLSENEYVKMIADEGEPYKLSINLESEIESVRKEFDDSETALKLKELFNMRSTGDRNVYYSEMSKLTEELKDNYRDIVLDTERTDDGTESD